MDIFFLPRIRNFAEKEKLIEKGDRIVLGVSGGADSVALLYVLCALSEELSLKLKVVTIDHGLREAAKEECRYVEDLCKELNVPFVLRKYDVNALSKEWNIGTEEAGRRVRYEAFEEEAKAMGDNSKIAVAHNLNDMSETVLFHLFRGTGPKGLVSIPPKRGNIIRPLLCVERKEIEEFLKKENIRYYTDATNLTDDYTRNKIRHNILEYASGNINDNAVLHVSEAAETLRELTDFVDYEVEERFNSLATVKEHEIVLSALPLKDEKPYIVKALFKKCMDTLVPKNRDITKKHFEALYNALSSTESKSFNLPYGITVLKENGTYKFFTEEDTFSFASVSLTGKKGIIDIDEDISVKWEVLPYNADSEISKNKYTKCFDYDKISECLMLRTALEGDYLTIDINLKKKKLSDYYIDEKIPISERKKTLIIADGPHVWWVIGHRISEFPKITDDTKRMIRITFDNKKELL